ncbi:hypothetical protein B0H63DRAFT_497059 [Podospora didyma]|uniref:C2H2-type domain-containing protein n=1 Tax=Podospora didyma TaxID=330526 RepID=A0AAE0KAI8_9PEZI|nr:hypothetical protein B0H63DRAFT_497059 [Podospora didyma]
MDLDIDLDCLAWAAEDFDYAFDEIHSQLGAKDCTSTATGFPLDLLFAEDEGTSCDMFGDASMSDAVGDTQTMSNSHGPQLQSPADYVLPPAVKPVASDYQSLHSDTDAETSASQPLRRQLSLLAKGSCGDVLLFRNCEPSKAVVLHSLAMEFGLGYAHDVWNQGVSISRITTESGSSFIEAAHTQAVSHSFTNHGAAPPSPSVAIHGFGIMTQYSRQTFDDDASLLTATPSIGENNQLTRQPSRSRRLGESISKHWNASIAKGGRRGPLSETSRLAMKALEEAGGACWRCKVLRRKCDPGTPCRCCLQSVPIPHLGEDAPLWPLIGCRRGPLRESIPMQVFCPESQGQSRPETSGSDQTLQPRRSLDIAGRCLLSAESQRLADMKASLECASYKLSIDDPALRDSFISFIEAGRYRNQDSLHRAFPHQGTAVTYADLIPTIAWELAENNILLPLLEIRSWDAFMEMLETASIYESEIGQTSLVMISLICLRHCFEALRLHSADLLNPRAHVSCRAGQCQVHYIRDLSLSVTAYIDELSSVIFNKDNMRDRRWWLSTFYSLCIQSHVRHAVIAIEKQLCFQSADEDLISTQYLHLAAMLFTAASAKYDPLLGGRHQYTVTENENSVTRETTVPELHHSSARKVCEVDSWPECGIKSSYEFLRRALQIGSLDFASGQMDHPMSDLQSPSETPETSDPSRRHQQRDSIFSITSLTSMAISNPSSVSLTRTLDTDVTSIFDSIYEQPLSPVKASFGDDSASLSTARVHVEGTTANPPPVSQTDKSGQATLVAPNSEASQASVGEAGSFICNCCPRGPRRFATSEELATHEAEKPHPCSQCKKRFKSPTEAERHINAVHLKLDFWSCQALANPLDAFHSETYNGEMYDICGLCGGGFAQGADRDIPELISHLESVHKHGECDRDKKFFRVDNYRSHLRIAHVSKPGKWLKVLEKTCRMTRAPE